MTATSHGCTDSRVPPLNFCRRWWGLIAVLLLARMFIVSHDEIVPQTFDATYYAQMASHYFQDNDFSILPTHRPGVSLIAIAARSLGIPYKLLVDLSLMGLAIGCGTFLLRLTGSSVAGFILFASVLFHPWFVTHSRLAMSEPITSVFLALILVTGSHFWIRRPERWSISNAAAASFVASAWILSRNEMALLSGFYVLVLAVVIFQWRRRNRTDRDRDYSGTGNQDNRSEPTNTSAIWKRPGGWRFVLVALPITVAIITSMTIKSVNHTRYGVKAICATEADGFNDLITALYSIVPEQQLIHVPVTRQSLAKACQVSPVLARLSDRMLDDNRLAYQICRQNLNMSGQVGPWLNWHIIDCFDGVDRNSNQQMRVAAREIREAQSRGELGRRTVFFPIDPLWNKWLPALPARFLRALTISTFDFHVNYQATFERRRVTNPVEDSFFDNGFLRRAGLDRDSSIVVYGQSALEKGNRIQAVQVLNANGELLQQIPVYHHLDKIMFAMHLGPAEFALAGKPQALRLVLSGFDDLASAIYSEPATLPQFANKETVRFLMRGAGGDAAYQIEWAVSVNKSMPPSQALQDVRSLVMKWPWLGLVCSVAATFLVCLVRDVPRRVDVKWVAIVGVLFVLARCLFYSLIDCWLAWGLHRYVEPNLFVTLVALNAAAAWLASVLHQRMFQSGS